MREWEEEGFVPKAVPGHPQPQSLTLKGMQFELNSVRPLTSDCLRALSMIQQSLHYVMVTGPNVAAPQSNEKKRDMVQHEQQTL